MMNFKNKTMILVGILGFLLAGCGSSSEDTGAPTSSNSVTATVGSGGGSVSLPDKTVVTIDPGVLKDGTTITVTTTPAPASTSEEIRSISPLITLEIPADSLMPSSVSDLAGISVEIPLNEGQTSAASAVKAVQALTSKSYRIVKVTLQGGVEVAHYGKLAVDAAVAKVKLGYNIISDYIQIALDQPIDGNKLTVGFNAQILLHKFANAGTLFSVESEDSLTPVKSVVAEVGKKLPLILVHGIQLSCNGNATAYKDTWKAFIKKFSSTAELQSKYQLYSFSYRTDLSIKGNALLLAQVLRDTFGERPLIVVAHSMGGLVTRSSMIHHAAIGANIEGLITLGTPHHGVRRKIEIGADLLGTLGGSVNPVCLMATESDGANDMKWDNFDNLNGPFAACENPFLCGPNGLNIIDKITNTNYEKYLPYAGVWTITPILDVGPTCLLSNLVTPTPFSKCNDGFVPVSSARFMDFNMDFDTDIYIDKLQWSGRDRTYSGISHSELHDDPGVLNQVTQDLLAFYDSISVPPPVTNTAPTATITSPVGGTFNQGDVVAFGGTGNDVEDGALSGGALVWTSSIDGQIGTGTSFTKSDLSVGTHIISLTATDSQGATRSDLTSITIDSITVVSASLNITKPGTGSGTVTSSDGRINCGVTCQASFTSGTIVNLTATSDTGSDFDSWGGACAGTVGATCTLTINVDKTATAMFTVQGDNPPTAKIFFPPPVSMTDAAQITVRGTATDETGVSSVLVNGVSATTSDGFANWQAVVTLSPGDNTLVAVTSDTLGNINANAASANIKRQTIFFSPRSVALDATNNRALVIDSGLAALVAVDLTTGGRSALSDDTIGTGTKFRDPRGVALDAANNRALVTDFGQAALFAVDLTTGNRSVLSDTIIGTGTIFTFPVAVALDEANNRALVIATGGRAALFAVDLTTGNRSVLSDATIGTGSNFSYSQGIALDAANNRVLVVDSNQVALFSVDLTTGNRTILADITIGTGTNFDGDPEGVALDVTNNRALVIDSDLAALVAVDLTTGNRIILSDTTTGTGTNFGRPEGVALDTTNNRALVIDSRGQEDALFAVDLATGNRTILSDATIGTGTNFRSPGYIAIDTGNNRVLVIDSDSPRDALVAVDLSTGNRSIFSDATTGTGTNFRSPLDIAIDVANNRALIIWGNPTALASIGLSTGNRSILSDATTGTGTNLWHSRDIAIDATNNRALVIDISLNPLIAVDLTTGNRSTLSDATTGTGINFIDPVAVAIDAANNRVLVTDGPLNALVAVDLSTGNRSILSDATTGTGINFVRLGGIAIDAGNNRVLVIDTWLNMLIEVDLSTGNRSIFFDPTLGFGGNFLGGIAIDSENNNALVTDRGRDVLLAVDLRNGERVIISR